MKMYLKKNPTIPRFVRCPRAETAFLIAAFLEKHFKYTLDDNVKAESFLPNGNEEVWNAGRITICINGDRKNVTLWDYGTRTDRGRSDAIAFDSFKAFVDTLVEPLIRAAGYDVEFMEDGSGINVGCQFVPWTVIDRIVARRPDPVVAPVVPPGAPTRVECDGCHNTFEGKAGDPCPSCGSDDTNIIAPGDGGGGVPVADPLVF